MLLKLTLFVIIIWCVSAFLIIQGLDNWADRGTFGDMFGAVNALFSGLAFAALIYTIVLQREDIQHNREEISMNRTELHKSVKAQQKSLAALKLQAKQTHLTAKVNAMNSLLSYYNSQIESDKTDEEIKQKAREKRKAIIKQIDDLIDGLDDSSVE